MDETSGQIATRTPVAIPRDSLVLVHITEPKETDDDMMIAVFGANGPTGRILTRQALAEGHEVTAFTRRPSAFPQLPGSLRVLGGDVADPDAVAAAVDGQDAVVSTLGAPFGRRPVTVYDDMRRMEELVQRSNLAWTIVRPSGLFSAGAVSDYEQAEDHVRGRFTAREDLADCLLRQSADDTFVNRAIGVATTTGTPNMLTVIWREGIRRDPASR